jgi:hypothetical protein
MLGGGKFGWKTQCFGIESVKFKKSNNGRFFGRGLASSLDESGEVRGGDWGR